MSEKGLTLDVPFLLCVCVRIFIFLVVQNEFDSQLTIDYLCFGGFSQGELLIVGYWFSFS